MTDPETSRASLEAGRRVFLDEVDGLSLDEALDAAGGFRSILGLMKHTAGWSDVYRSYAFDDVPRSWTEIDWPRGLRERVDPSDGYLEEIRQWFERSSAAWLDALDDSPDLGEPRPVHWGAEWPLRAIVAEVATHWAYHAGEINLILAVRRGEGWEYGEHVEENHLPSVGHSVRRDWITDEDAKRYDDEMRSAAAEGPTARSTHLDRDSERSS